MQSNLFYLVGECFNDSLTLWERIFSCLPIVKTAMISLKEDMRSLLE